MKAASDLNVPEYSAPRRALPEGVSLVAACVLLASTVAGCATTSRSGGNRSTPCTHGCRQAPVNLRKKLSAGDVAVELAMGLGESRSGRYANANDWYHRAAAQGNPTAEFALGYEYDNGLGVKRSYAQAFHWYRKAAIQGLPQAEYWVGLYYPDGRGVARDYSKANDWFRKAANRDLAVAEYGLGYN